jgi:septal ring factor EnvC (AmiA/AmiB activator)
VSDTSKYDLFMDEIVSLEKMIQKFVAQKEEIEDEKLNLQKKLNNLEKENEILIQKIKGLEKQLNNPEENIKDSTKSKLDLSERENLKNQIDDLISRIDYHIRS